MVLYKLVTLAVIVGVFASSLALWRMGKELNAFRVEKGVHDSALLVQHRTTVAIMGCLTLLAVVLIEFQVRTSPRPYDVNPWLLGFHLLFDSMLIATGIAIVMRFNGLYNQRWHRRFVRAFFAWYLLAFATGSVLLYELPT